jgi:hypothetical protein
MNKPLCVLSAPVFSRSGYGAWATDVSKSILRYDKFDLKIVPQRWGNCQSKRFLNELTDPEDINVRSCFLTSNVIDKQPDVFISMSIPNEFQNLGKFNIGMTAGIETTICSGEFLEGVNKMDVTIATSNHAKHVFETSKLYKKLQDGSQHSLNLQKPVEVCFWGANTNVFKKTDEKVESVESIMKKIDERFAFLFVGQWTHGGLYSDRKDIGNLIKTFTSTFKSTEKTQRPCLILKTSGSAYSTTDRFDMLNKIKTIQSEIGGDCPNVYLLHGELNDVELNALFNHEKIVSHISFTHGEGYGHPLLLQTLSGKPLLVSNWSGHLDFLNEKYAELLKGSLSQIPKESANKWLLPESKWFNVSYGSAEEHMKKIFFSRKNEKIIEKAEKLRIENMSKFSLNKMDERLWQIFDQYIPTFSIENKFVLPKLKSVNEQSEITLPKLKLS